MIGLLEMNIWYCKQRITGERVDNLCLSKDRFKTSWPRKRPKLCHGYTSQMLKMWTRDSWCTLSQSEGKSLCRPGVVLWSCVRAYSLNMMSSCFSGSDDLSAKLWDVRTGQCIYGIQTHTCATVKFDEQKLVTGSFDNTIACWEWSTGAKIQQFRGHTGAGEFKCSAIIYSAWAPSEKRNSIFLGLFTIKALSFSNAF